MLRLIFNTLCGFMLGTALAAILLALIWATVMYFGVYHE